MPQRPLTFGSLFAGIGGFDLGFERAGMVCKWQVEIDPFCRNVLAKHWPDVRRHDDIVTWPTKDAEQVDVICGGFPCQDISYAGKGAGLGGKRSGLFFEAIRVVRQLRPQIVVLENVAALLTRGVERVLGELAEIGFDAEWHCIPAISVGAPHIRDRLFVIAYASGDGRRQGRTRGTSASSKSRKPKGENVPNPACQFDSSRNGSWLAEGRFPLGRCGSVIGGPWTTEPNVGRVANGVPDGLDRLRALGNAVVPQVAEWIGSQIVRAAGGVVTATPPA